MFPCDGIAQAVDLDQYPLSCQRAELVDQLPCQRQVAHQDHQGGGIANFIDQIKGSHYLVRSGGFGETPTADQ